MVDVIYTQSTQANRLLFIADLSLPTFQLEFIPNQGPLPDTWNTLGRWYIQSTSGVLRGISAQGPWSTVLPMLISTPYSTSDIQTGLPVLQRIYIRTRPWIPDGTIRVTFDPAPLVTTNLIWALALGTLPP